MYKVNFKFADGSIGLFEINAGNWLLAQRKVIKKLIDKGHDVEGIVDIRVTLKGEADADRSNEKSKGQIWQGKHKADHVEAEFEIWQRYSGSAAEDGKQTGIYKRSDPEGSAGKNEAPIIGAFFNTIIFASKKLCWRGFPQVFSQEVENPATTNAAGFPCTRSVVWR